MAAGGKLAGLPLVNELERGGRGESKRGQLHAAFMAVYVGLMSLRYRMILMKSLPTGGDLR